jgi:hypothetical protein
MRVKVLKYPSAYEDMDTVKQEPKVILCRSLLGIKKRPGHEANHSSAASVMEKNACGAIPLLVPYVFMV